MKKLIAITSAALLIAVTVAASAGAYEIRAVASGVKGAVERTTGFGENEWIKVKDGDALLSNDRIRTGADGSFIITYDDGNVVAVMPLTRVRIDEMTRKGNEARSEIQVRNGRVLAYAKKLMTPESTFVVKTPNGTAGVRGSEIAVTVDESSTLLEVVSGMFDVVIGDMHGDLTAGQQMTLGAGATDVPTASSIEPAKLEALKAEIAAKKKEGDANAQRIGATNDAVENAADMTDILNQIQEATQEYHDYYEYYY